MAQKMIGILLLVSTALGAPNDSPGPCVMMCPSIEDGSEICVTELMRCDHSPDCEKAQDEAQCACKGFKCAGGDCIRSEERCNGHPDCASPDDFSDEMNCTLSDYSRTQSTSKCPKYCRFGDCQFSADGQPACVCKPDFTGEFCEKNQIHTSLQSLPSAKEVFRCKNQGISMDSRCDGIRDCEDGEDEKNCTEGDYASHGKPDCPMPCIHGSCRLYGDSAKCVCYYGFEGDFCDRGLKRFEFAGDKRLSASHANSSSSSSGFVRAIVLPSIFAFGAGLFLWCMM